MLQSYLMISLNCSFCLLLLLVSIFICAIKKKYIVLHIEIVCADESLRARAVFKRVIKVQIG